MVDLLWAIVSVLESKRGQLILFYNLLLEFGYHTQHCLFILDFWSNCVVVLKADFNFLGATQKEIGLPTGDVKLQYSPSSTAWVVLLVWGRSCALQLAPCSLGRIPQAGQQSYWKDWKARLWRAAEHSGFIQFGEKGAEGCIHCCLQLSEKGKQRRWGSSKICGNGSNLFQGRLELAIRKHFFYWKDGQTLGIEGCPREAFTLCAE